MSLFSVVGGFPAADYKGCKLNKEQIVFNGIQFGGDSIGGHRISVKNVTGADLVKNGVYQLDLVAGDSDTSGASNVVKASLEDIIALTALGLTTAIVIVDKALADKDQGLAYLMGVCTVRVDASSYPIAKGDRLTAVAGSTDLIKLGAGFKTAPAESCAIALEAATTDNATIKVLFDGLNIRRPQTNLDLRTYVNRTGGALVAGGVYALDLLQVQGESTTPELALQNLTPVATGNLAGGLFVIATGTEADNAPAACYGPIGPIFIASVLVEGTTDILKGDRLAPTNGHAYLTKASVAAGSLEVGVATALEGFTTNGTGLIKAIFNGVTFNNSINGAVS